MVGNNIKHLRKKHQLSQQSLSEALDIPRTTLGDYERGNTEPNIALLINIAEYFNIGVEDLIKRDLTLERFEVAKTNKLQVLAITVDPNNEGNIELVESKAEAGYLDSYQNPEYIKDLPKIRFPNLGEGTYRGFEITGDSMLPIESGSIIICSFIENLNEIKDDKTYIVISKKDGLVYKRLRNNKENNSLILISDNNFYLPYELHYDEVEQVWQYYAHLSFSDRKNPTSGKIENQLNEINQKVSDLHKRYVGQ